MKPADRRRAGRHDPPRRRSGWLLLGAVTMACGGEGDAAAGPVADTVLPVVVEVPIPVPEHSPGSVHSPVVAGPHGGWLYGPGDVRSSALVLVESDGRDAVPLGGYGEGPGEMRLSLPLWLDDTVAIGFDLGTRRLMVWRRDGVLRREFRPSESVVPFARGPGSSLLASRFRGGVEVPVLVDAASGSVSDVLAPGDSVLIDLFREERGLSDRVANSPAIGRWNEGVVVGNGITYRIAHWRRDGTPLGVVGRDLPPVLMSDAAIERELRSLRASGVAGDTERLERIRQELAATPVRRFTQVGAPRSDARRRLWVVVKEGDSVAADVFSEAGWLGRLPLACPGFEGRWDLNGTWLLLVCHPRDPASDLDAEVRRYRIEGS